MFAESNAGNIDCNEAQKIFTFALLKAKEEVTVVRFTDDRNKLKPVAWNEKSCFTKADEDIDVSFLFEI